MAATAGTSTAGRLFTDPVFLFGKLRRECLAEVGCLEHRADFDLAWTGHRIGAALHPLHSFSHVLDLPEPEASDYLAGLGKGPVDDGALRAVKGHALAVRGRVQTLAGQEDTGTDQ